MQIAVGFDWELDLEWDSTSSWTWSGTGIGSWTWSGTGTGSWSWPGTGSWIWSRAGMNDSKSTVQGLSKCLSPTPFDV